MIDAEHQETHAQFNEGKGFYSFTHRHPHRMGRTVVYLIRMQSSYAYKSLGRGWNRNCLTSGKNHYGVFTISLRHFQRYVYLPDSFEMFRKLWPRACLLNWLHAVITPRMFSETYWVDGQFPGNNIPWTNSCFSLSWILFLKYLPVWLTKTYCLHLCRLLDLFIHVSISPIKRLSLKGKIGSFLFVTPVSIKMTST